MGKSKHCIFPKCNSDTRYAHKPHMEGVGFVPFPKPKQKAVYCNQWVNWMSKFKPGFSVTNINYDTYLCTKHLTDDFFKTQLWLKLPILKPPVITIIKSPVALLKELETNVQHAASILKVVEINPHPASGRDSITMPDSNLKGVDLYFNENENLEIDEVIPVQLFNIVDHTYSLPCTNNDYCHSQDLSSSDVKPEEVSHFMSSRKSLVEMFSSYAFPKQWAVNFDVGFRLFKMNYQTGGAIISIMISPDFNFSLSILNKSVTKHTLIPEFPSNIMCQEDLTEFMEKLNSLNICAGTQEETYRNIFNENLVPNSTMCWITNSIRHTSCCLLSEMKRCGNCVKLRSYFRVKLFRQKKEKIKTPAFKSLTNSHLLIELMKSKYNEINLKKKLKRREKNK